MSKRVILRMAAVSRVPGSLAVLAICLLHASHSLESAEEPGPGDRPGAEVCGILADERLAEPLKTIAGEYGRRTGSRITVKYLSLSEVNARLEKKQSRCDVVVVMAAKGKSESAVGALPGATKVAWKYPSREPVWAVALTKHADADSFVRFLGGSTGHRLWSESEAGFTIIAETTAEAYEWVVENRTKHTYPMTAMRMLAEVGGIRDGIMIDVGCGPGHLELELAKRSNFKIIGLDIDPDAKPLFERRIRAADLQDRVSFVVGDAQKLPFPDDYADVIVSRGTLIFIPDLKKCLREVDRVLKPTGVAFMGGRYVYAPQAHKIPTEKLKQIVEESGVPGARVIDARGQWVKIVGSRAPEEAQHSQTGPHMLANRFIADYGITEGRGLMICGNDGDVQQALQRGFLDMTTLDIVSLYPSAEVASQAEKRIEDAGLADRITCRVGKMQSLPFEDASFDLVAGVGPLLIWEKDKASIVRELHRILRPGGAALIGGRYLHMPEWRRVTTESLRQDLAKAKISSVRVYDEMGQWVEIRKGIKDRGARD